MAENSYENKVAASRCCSHFILVRIFSHFIYSKIPFNTSSPLMRLDFCVPLVGNRINGFLIAVLIEGRSILFHLL